MEVGAIVLDVLLLVGVVIVWLVPSVVCFLKGKWVSGLVGIIGIIVGVGWIWACGAAVRLAKPGSVWARKRYFGEKWARARERYPDDASVADAEKEEVKVAWGDEEVYPSELDRITRRALRKAGRLP